jgi:hypothetical protein
VVTHICDSGTQGTLRQEEHEFEVSLGYTARPCLEKRKGGRKREREREEGREKLDIQTVYQLSNFVIKTYYTRGR